MSSDGAAQAHLTPPVLRLRGRLLAPSCERPLVMGILNLGPDSVADETRLATARQRIARGLALAREGADMIDVGALSGRTDTEPIGIEEEVELLAPVIGALSAEGILTSVDTWRPEAARAALEAGAAIINDTGGLADPRLAELAGETGAGLVLMHTRAEPKREHFPRYQDLLADVLEMLRERIELAGRHGVAREQLILDPGLDYAKTPAQTIELLRRLPELLVLERPLLLAVSRKYFIGMIGARAPTARLGGTLAAVEHGLRAGAGILRVHDVAEIREYLQVREALSGESPPRLRGSRDDVRLKWIAPKRLS
jgi:dihydropteroate synthase